MPTIIGVDAGGTSTRIAGERDGASIGVFDAAPANVRRSGVDEAASIVVRGIESLLQGTRPDVVMVGAAGAGSPAIASSLRAALEAQLGSAKVLVDDDAFVALRAGVPQGDGIVLIAGTGSLAMASAGGERYRSGGHGFLLDDAGSGAWIGASAVRQLLRAYDERHARDGMMEAVASALRASSVADVHDAIYGEADPVRKLASLAPIVIEAASTGDRAATKIVQGAALELSELVRNVARRARLADRDTAIVLSGGLLTGNSLLSYLVETRLVNELPHAEIRKGFDPVEGALALARAHGAS